MNLSVLYNIMQLYVTSKTFILISSIFIQVIKIFKTILKHLENGFIVMP